MINMTVMDGALYQWDTGRKIRITPRSGEVIELVHYNNGNAVDVEPDGDSIVAPIPDVLLQTAENITAYAVTVSPDGIRTRTDCTFSVRSKPKPDGYTQKDAIEEARKEGYNSGYEEGHSEGYGHGYAEGKDAGQTAEYDRFWNSNQNGGNRRNYYYVYSYTGWTDDCFNPKYPIICEGGSTNGQNIFYNNTVITRIPVDITVNGISARQMFYRCNELKTIKKLVLNGATDLSNMFINCTSLENITIEGSIDVNFNISATAVLSAASVQSIIDHLADLTGQAQQTVGFHSDVILRLTVEQVETITSKNWTF